MSTLQAYSDCDNVVPYVEAPLSELAPTNKKRHEHDFNNKRMQSFFAC